MRLPSPTLFKQEFAPSREQAAFIARSRQCAREILEGKDPRLVSIIGPCSIHDVEAALDYASRLHQLAGRLVSSSFLVMRVFCEKPRTRFGWRGLLYDPDLDHSDDVVKGLTTTRTLLLALAERGVPCAAEFLDPIAAVYYEDLITWGFIGARTSASQPHRQLASSFSFPIGFKNTLYGEVDVALHGMQFARMSQSFLGIDETGCAAVRVSEGNPYTHLVLRGSETGPNFDPLSFQEALLLLGQHELTPRIMIDCSHGNSGKRHERQRAVFESVVGREGLIGVMVESSLHAGKQERPLRYGVSVTDSCMGWEETEELLSTVPSCHR